MVHLSETTPPPPATSRSKIVAGWALIALCTWGGASILRAMYARPQTVAMWPAAGFLIASLAGVVVLGMAPTAHWFRARRVLADWRATFDRCPACGAPREGQARCARCGHDLTRAEAFWVLGGAHWSEIASLGFFGLGLWCLSGFFGLVVSHAPRLSTAVVLGLMGLGVFAVGSMLVWAAVAGTRRVLAQPTALSFNRAWMRDGALWFTSANASLRDGVWRAEGSTNGPTDDPPAQRDDAPATPFEIGLARLLADWDRNDLAPLSCACAMQWRWPTETRPELRPERAYRDPAPPATRDDGVGTVRDVWRVSFNQYGFLELLDEAQLTIRGAPDDDDFAELVDAEWDIDVATLVRVISDDTSLREALASRGAAADDDAQTLRALRAVRSVARG